MTTGRRRGADRVMPWLAATILCLLAGHAPAQGRGTAERETLVARSNNQTIGAIPSSFSNPGMSSTLFVPVLLNASGQNNSFFTSELTLTNRGGEEATLHYTYTAHRGGGSGTATDRLAPGQQRIESDAIGYLIDLGLPIPSSGHRLGTLRVEVSGSSEVGVSVRTTTSVPEGRAGLAYPAIAATAGFEEAVYLCGLRQNTHDRSNVAFQHMGSPEEGPITLRTTVFSGEPSDPTPRVLEEVTLEPGGFHQYNGILNRAGLDNGYVKVERVEGEAPFYAYGVINDQANSDGSFVFPVTASSLEGTTRQTLPVIVETGVFTSELMVTNFSDVAKTVTFRFRAEAVRTRDKTATLEWTLQPGQQVIVPNIVEVMRQRGTGGISPSGQTVAGALFATVARGDMSGIVVGARTSASDGRGGQYGVSYNAVPDGESFTGSAWVDGLQQNEENRSNLALVNTGEVDLGPSVFQLDIYDGATGMLAHTVNGLKVAAKGWRQINGILGKYAPGTTQGYVRIRKISGNNPFLAYGVINDGGAPGERSGDGAYLPAGEAIHDPGTEPMTDREVLEVLYHTTGGPSWKNRTHWLSDLPLSEWHGVATDASGRVTSLALDFNGLGGTIPPALGQLTRLQRLDLGGNQLTGVIPPELGKLTLLQELELGGNRLSGGIPSELGQLTKLQRLELVINALSGMIPPELGKLTLLQELELGANRLSGGIPPELGQLSRLRKLGLAANQLRGKIPPELGRLTQLQRLSLTLNQLSGGIPPELGGLTQLQQLSLSINQLSGGIPPELGGLTQLQQLELEFNQLVGGIPPELGKLTLLQKLELGTNQLSGAIPPELGGLTQLQRLSLSINQLSRGIPPELGGLTQLQALYLRDNELSGAIPKNLQQLSELTALDIRGTGVCVPADAAFQAWLDTLSRFSSSGLVCDGTRQIVFSAPTYQVREGETVEVSVHLIDQTGDVDWSARISLTAKAGGGATLADYSGVPESITITAPATEAGFVVRAVKDDHIDHGETVVLGLRRPLPPGVIAGDPGMATVSIHDPGTDAMTDREVLEALYHLAGGTDWSHRAHWLSDLPLSEWYGVGTDESGRVTRLSLSYNSLSGTIPAVLDQLTRLESLNLRSNQLSGEIPAELAGLSYLRRLNLGGNQLSGTIPAVLDQLTRLESLNLWSNQLSGEIPVELAGLSYLRSLNLGGNQLSGTIPAELGGLAHLQSLHLGFNDLSGAIPVELAGATRLQVLNLRDNQLSGKILPELGALTQLQELELGQNQLTGGIPLELSELTQLQGLNLEHNELRGRIPTELGGLMHLQWLFLGGNQLGGTIPPELSGLNHLQALLLTDNQLSGGIPPGLGRLTQLRLLFLGFNDLSGAIPPELGGLTQLRELDLGGNQLSGAVPSEVGGLTNLGRLDLGFNENLTGTTPPGLHQLPLWTLDLMATSVCVPKDEELQEWLATIKFVPSGLTCGRPADAMSSIDIAVFYTPAAGKIVGGTAEMESVIDLKIAETNQAYLDSGVNQRLVLVVREEVQYQEEGSGRFALFRLSNPSDGYMDEVHSIRDQFGADLVHLIADENGPSRAFWPGAYSHTCARCPSSVFAHELGHNMGLSHDRYVDGGDGLFPYSHGYVNQQAFADGAPESTRWTTIMAYTSQCSAAVLNCNRVLRFSNPNQTYLGDPLGVPGHQRTSAVNGPADAVRTLNITRHSVASFRPRASANRLTMPATVSQGRSMVRTVGAAVLVPGGGLFRTIAPNVGGAPSRQAGGGLDRAILRRREVSVDIGRLDQVVNGEATALRLNLFDDVALMGIIERWTPTYSGGTALSGRLAGVPGGTVTLVVNGSVVAGTVRIPGATYRIRPAGAGRHAIMQVDPSQLLQECEVVTRAPSLER